MKVNAKVLKKENASASLQIEVGKENVIEEFNRIIKDYTKKANIPGFRKGKAPEDMIRSKFKSNINEDVLRTLIPKAYSESLNITNLIPYTEPDIRITQFSDNDNLTFEVDIQLRPEVVLGPYKELSFHQVEYKIEDKDINLELDKLRERFADLILKEGQPVTEKDVVIMEVKAYDESGEFLADLSNDNHKVEMDKNNLFEEFYKALIKAKMGDEKEIIKKYPADFNNKLLADKTVKFKIKIKEVREKRLPELNDDFAKDIGEYKNLDDLRQTIEKQIIGIIKKHSQEKLENEIVDKLIENSRFEIPEKLIEKRTESVLHEFQHNLTMQGHDMKKLMAEKVIDLEKLRSESRDQALKDLKSFLVIYKISEAENIKIEESEINAFIEAEAKKMNKNQEEYKKNLNPDSIEYIRQILIKNKILDFLKQNNKIKKGKVFKFKELLKEMEQKK